MPINLRHDRLRVGVINPLHGPLGIIGPAAQLCAELAARELNSADGILGREVELVTLDGADTPTSLAHTVDRLISTGRIDAVVGTHTSAVRQQLAPAVAGRIPYVYSSLYEGGESHPGVFVTGETTDSQLLPALDLLRTEHSVTSWSIVGSDYIWPHTAAAETARHLETTGCYLDRVEFFPIGTSDYASGLDRLAQSPATGVVVLLIGQDAVEFHRQFHAQGLDEKMIRVTPLMDENMILAAGPDACRQLYVSAGYFYSLPTAASMEFVARYTDAFGVDAPMVGTMAESCYEAIHLLAALAARAKSLRVDDMIQLGDNLVFENVRGTHRLRHSHTQNPIYLADVEGMDFRILTELSSGSPG